MSPEDWEDVSHSSTLSVRLDFGNNDESINAGAPSVDHNARETNMPDHPDGISAPRYTGIPTFMRVPYAPGTGTPEIGGITTVEA